MIDKIEAVDWTTVNALKETKLAALVTDLKEANQAVKDAEARKDSLRQLIHETIEPIGTTPILCNGLRVQWVAGRVTEKLDRALLVKAGVTPNQLQKATVSTTSKPFLDVKPIKGAE